ncbi:hypothetical protein GQ53DRAFT_661349 [Thozetella sp. PMI_491]|nr:hypothetical protein GQ53DRAFT_661349 [Thozetella sp. PMI_491]
MPPNSRFVDFPNVEAKLQQPRGQSAFERQKAEAEAKRKREAAETAAVYEDFVKSFDNDSGDDGYDSRPPPPRFGGSSLPDRPTFGGQAPYGGAGGKRHFGASSVQPMKSGPGSLGPGPTSFGKKRPYDGFQPNNQRDRDDGRAGRLGFDDHEAGPLSVSKVFNASDDEEEQTTAVGRAEEKAISKPTLRLANLPPGTSPAVIKALIPPNLTVENVKVVPPAGPGSTERKSLAAIVTLSQETPATEIDTAVSSLQNRYLGFGFYLSLHRHLSSAAISASSLPAVTSSSSVAHPFGAKRVADSAPGIPSQPVGFGRGFAPPSSYGPPGGGPVNKTSLLHVSIQPPKDVKKLRMIHKVVESVLEHGPEFEALLMSRPDVQKEEKWAWIWDARSEGGVWYRWRLWEIVTGSQRKGNRQKYLPLFEGSHAWKLPDLPLFYEFTTGVDEFVSDSEYNSSDQDDYEDEQNRQGDAANNDQEDMFLAPMEKAKLAHLLARLPKTLSKLRKGDIARITSFAITHASRGSDEIVDMIINNIEKPFSCTSANPDYRKEGKRRGRQEEESRDPSPSAEDKANNDTADTSGARLLGLYVVSDILSCSSTSGIRHAWRYRQLFETALRTRNIFEMLGALPTKLTWGRLRVEKWKRSVGLVLSLWEGWCVFPIETHEAFVKSFEDPPLLKKDLKTDDGERKGGKWKTVDASTSENTRPSGFRPVSDPPSAAEADNGTGADDVGEDSSYDTYSDVDPLDLDEILAGEMLDGTLAAELHVLLVSVDGDTAMGGTADGGTKVAGKEQRQELKSSVGSFQVSGPSTRGSGPRKRMRAVDMFADSGSEGDS